ncbi:hypothetical protein BDR26DRAFT_894713 [Obelidium mucronatum]|nr:hypothetical protein BDR26DRAFT_894713 [Obelidium mucronatum]
MDSSLFYADSSNSSSHKLKGEHASPITIDTMATPFPDFPLDLMMETMSPSMISPTMSIASPLEFLSHQQQPFIFGFDAGVFSFPTTPTTTNSSLKTIASNGALIAEDQSQVYEFLLESSSQFNTSLSSQLACSSATIDTTADRTTTTLLTAPVLPSSPTSPTSKFALPSPTLLHFRSLNDMICKASKGVKRRRDQSLNAVASTTAPAAATAAVAAAPGKQRKSKRCYNCNSRSASAEMQVGGKSACSGCCLHFQAYGIDRPLDVVVKKQRMIGKRTKKMF